MKILFVIPEYPPHSGGGIIAFYRHLIPELSHYGHQIRVLVGSSCTPNLPSYKENGVEIDFLDTNLVDTYVNKFDHYKAIPEFQRHLAASWAAWEQVNGGDGYDLVEVSDWGMLFVPWIVSTNSPPTIVQLHASIGQIDFYDPQLDSQLQGNLIRLLESNLLSNADELQTYSQSNAQAWKNITNRNVNYIPPALPIMPIIKPPVQSTNGLVVGRVQYWKGVTILCEALRLLGNKAATIDWIGRDTAYRDSKSSMSAYLIENYSDIWQKKVNPLGTFSPEETRQLQASAKFIIVPSIWDVFNYTCVEGMAQGQVVLCSEGAGASGLIINAVNGLTFKANDAQSLANALETVMSWSPAKLEEVGNAAKETILKTLDPQLIAQKRIDAYENLLKRGKSEARPNQWLIDAVSPQKKLDNPLAFLDRLPLRELISYTINRSIRKTLKRT